MPGCPGPLALQYLHTDGPPWTSTHSLWVATRLKDLCPLVLYYRHIQQSLFTEIPVYSLSELLLDTKLGYSCSSEPDTASTV